MKFLTTTAWAAALGALLAAGPAAAASWTVDTARSKLGFTGSQSGAAFSGQFTRWDATIDFDPANPATGHATVTIDMASAKTGDVQKDQSLPEADWFSTKAFPKAVFEATSFKSVSSAKGGGNQYEAVGTLTIRGIKKDVTLPFTLDVAGGKAHAVGKLDLVRTDYGVGQGAWSDGKMVALAVSVTVDLNATTK
ncbi:YceI family protein [Nitrospirillum pindoramense]|uniref:Polyisoprenoid-binding protein YceI n=1 Tax=Nitrospirillum amazonense TaxID=28077 RepID=A0A560HAD0_9PROT|nr:YceI family protein [Nitrospirillum amazonense]TWB43292.1 polyisoprenoid-binding protein YceI [Nitrospirillum amazonense]